MYVTWQCCSYKLVAYRLNEGVSIHAMTRIDAPPEALRASASLANGLSLSGLTRFLETTPQ